MEKQIQVNSEIGRLKTVLLHRPGEELEALTPEYMSRMLFDDVPYLKVAQEEHDAFANVLRENGVEVLYLDQLAAEALANEEVRDRFIVEMVRASKQEETFSTFAIVNYLQTLDPLTMVRKVMAGVKKSEVENMEPTNKQLHHFMVNDYPFYLDPMPNLYFTRDPAASIGNGLTINKMHWPARRRESLFMQYILKYHPRFANQNIPVWYNRNNRFSVEGGDELVLNKHTVAIGISERTEAEAIERIASRNPMWAVPGGDGPDHYGRSLREGRNALDAPLPDSLAAYPDDPAVKGWSYALEWKRPGSYPAYAAWLEAILDGHENEGPSAGPATLLGREIAAKNGWTEPVADKAADQAPTKATKASAKASKASTKASKASTKASNKKGVKAK